MTDPNPPTTRCTTCGRRSTTTICTACHTRAGNQLGEIPALLDRLAYATVTGPPPLAEFVSGRGFGSRAPVAMDALSLTVFTAPAIRLELTDPRPPTGEWGDSIPLWTTAWAAVWRHRYGHHLPAGVRVPRPAAPPPAAIAPLPTDPEALAAVLAAEMEARTATVAAELLRRAQDTRIRNRVILGLEVARTRNPTVADPTAPEAWTRAPFLDADVTDGLAAHWLARFGPPQRIHRLMTDLAYLAVWLDYAVEDFDDAHEFVLGLRSLIGAARAAVGDRSDIVRLGRCPEPVLDRDTGEEEPCGAWLARDPMVSLVICPRCQTETPERGLLDLAARMQAVYRAPAQLEA